MRSFKSFSRLSIILTAVHISVPASGAETRVDSLADSGHGSLREAVAHAADGDTVLLGATGTLVLDTPIIVQRSITITGEGGPLQHTLKGNGGRIFEIAQNRTVALSRLTLESGSADGDGGAIFSRGELSLSFLRLQSNTAAGLGGAIYQSGGSLSVDHCAFSQNTAGGGGAVASSGSPVTIASSGFFDNTASGSGGALLAGGPAMEILSSTFSGNAAQLGGGALAVTGGTGRLVNLTMVNNSAPQATQAEAATGTVLETGNSIIEGTDGFGGIAGTGTLVSLGNNLSDGPAAGWNASLDRSDMAMGLGEARDFGGLSRVYPLKPGSAAIDAGNNALISGRDQRGLARFSDGNGDGAGNTVDIGAFEVQLYVVSSLQILGSSTGGGNDGGYGNPFDPSDAANSISSADVFAQLTQIGQTDITDAIRANNAAGCGAVGFSESILPGRIRLVGSELEVRRDIAIYGPGADVLAIDGDGRSRIMRVGAGALVYIGGLALENGSAGSGSAIFVGADSALELEAVSVSGNAASIDGGGIAIDSGEAYILRSSLVGNTAQSQGGALASAPGTRVVIDTSTVSSNRAGARGGAVSAGGALWVESSTLAGNTAGSEAPGIFFHGTATGAVRNSIFSHVGADGVAAAPGAAVISSGNNISDAPDPLLTAGSDQLLTDPRIGALALNGGSTLSHAPLPGGPSINRGQNTDLPPVDQPGFTRIRGGIVDIGSVEFQNDPPEITCPLPVFMDCVDEDGASVTLTAWVDDLDGDPVTVTWRLNGAVFATDTLAAGATLPAELTKTLQVPIGDATITISATDSSAAGPQCTIPVSVLDRTPPALSLVGETTVALECGSAYTDAGATATDACDSSVTPFVSFTDLPESGPLDAGTYTITYSAADAAGNSASVTRTVVVTDTIPPLVTLNGADSLTLECGVDLWSDPGATAADLCDGNLPVTVTILAGGSEVASIDTGKPGRYAVVHTAVDAAGNSASTTRVVEIRDTIAPVVTAPGDLTELTDPAFCTAGISFAATATDNCAAAPAISYRILPNELYPSGQDISSPFHFAPGTHVVECTATDPSGNSASATFQVSVSDDFLNCVQNVSWPNALPLEFASVDGGAPRSAEVRQFLALTDQARWYRFSVQPGSRVTVILSELPANYDIVVYRDIAAEYDRLLNLFNSPDPEAQELALLGVEFAPESFSPESFSPESFSPESFSPESFSPESFSPESFSPESFSPESFSPESFSPESFSPESFSPESFSPESFSPESFSPESFSPESFSPESFSPESFSSAQVSSMIAYSAFPGVASEGVAINTFTRSGDFYVRVRGSNGTFSLEAPFKVSVIVEPEICDGLEGPETFGESTYPVEAGGYRSILLWDSTRTDGSPAEIAALEEKLNALAARPEVAGVVVDVSLELRVYNANLQADALPACPYSKNYVAEEIKALINSFRELNPDLHYIVLLGSDDGIPFFRTTDEAFLANESNYVPPVIDSTHSQSSLRFGQILTQDPYGATCELNLVTGPFPYPQLAVGRLVESAPDMARQIDNYLATTDGVIVSATSALVTGYDFLDDAARAVQFEFEQAIGGPVASLIADSTLSPSEGWTSAELSAALLGARHDLVFLAGHYSTGSALAADYETRLTAAQVLASGADFRNALVFSAGCHSGYNTVDAHAINGITQQPDWSQAFGRLGAIFVAGTGYQYGDTEFVEYGERLYLEFTRQLRTGTDPVAVGDALVRAKRKYLAETPLMRGIHEKSLVQTTLYGLPMAKVRVPGARLTATSIGTRLPVVPQGSATNPGLTLGLATADVAIQPALTPRSLDLLNIDDGTTVTAQWFEGRNGIVSNPAEPIRPLEVYLASVSGTLLRGVGFRGGRYDDLAGFLPLTGAPTTEIRGVYGNFFSEVFFPVQPYSLNYFGILCGGTDGETRLNVYPAQYLAAGGGTIGGTMRTYSGMDLRLFYSNNRETYTASGVPSIPALSGPPSLAQVRSSTSADGSAIDFQISVLGNPAAGIQEVWITYTGVPGSLFHGEWRSLDLARDPDDSTRWLGSLPLQGALPDELRFMVQAASGTGLVALNTNSGNYYQVDLDELAARIPTRIELLDPPSTGAYGESVPVRARLTAGGAPLASAPVGFRIGSANIRSVTDADGVASVQVPLSTRPSVQSLQAYFQGDREFAPSAGGSQVTIVKQSTVLTFQPVPAEPTGSDVVVALADAIGTPLKERTVFFLVDYGSFQVGSSVISDFAGRADLSEVDLPAGDVLVTAYFNGTIPVPGSDPVTIGDDLYLPAVASIGLRLVDPEPEDSLRFEPRKVDMFFRAPFFKRKFLSAPFYSRASIVGDIAFTVPLQPAQLLAAPAATTIQATIESRFAGELLASESFILHRRGNSGDHWTTPIRFGAEVLYAGIHWKDAPRFDSSMSPNAGPRIQTSFIGNTFSEIQYLPNPGTYKTTFPDGSVVAVKDGVINPAGSSALAGKTYAIEGGVLVLKVRYRIVPGMQFVTSSSPAKELIAAVTVTAGENYLPKGGRMIIHLNAVKGTPRPPANANPDLFETFITIGSGEGETAVNSTIRIGDGEGALPWSSESANRKQYRP